MVLTDLQAVSKLISSASAWPVWKLAYGHQATSVHAFSENSQAEHCFSGVNSDGMHVPIMYLDECCLVQQNRVTEAIN